MSTDKFYPRLSSVVLVDEIPDQIGFLTEPDDSLLILLFLYK